MFGTWRVDGDRKKSPAAQYRDAAETIGVGKRHTIHSACDNCRAKKLKCSGEIRGCRRCRQTDTACSYSAEPDGRRRKRTEALPRTGRDPWTERSTERQSQPLSAFHDSEEHRMGYSSPLTPAIMDPDLRVEDWTTLINNDNSVSDISTSTVWPHLLLDGDSSGSDGNLIHVGFPDELGIEGLDTPSTPSGANSDIPFDAAIDLPAFSDPAFETQQQQSVILNAANTSNNQRPKCLSIGNPRSSARPGRENCSECLTSTASLLAELNAYATAKPPTTTDRLIEVCKAATKKLNRLFQCTYPCASRTENITLVVMVLQHMFMLSERMADRQLHGIGSEGFDVRFGGLLVTIPEERDMLSRAMINRYFADFAQTVRSLKTRAASMPSPSASLRDIENRLAGLKCLMERDEQSLNRE